MSDRTTSAAKSLQADVLLLIMAAIWGTAFVAQREGAGFVPPLAFISLRYFLGAFSLFPVIWYMDRKLGHTGRENRAARLKVWRLAVPGGFVIGTVLFLASFLQQKALEDATAGQAGFITSLYVVLVPLTGILTRKYKPAFLNIVSVLLAAFGLYLLSVQGNFTLHPSDLLLMISAVFYTLHILSIDKFGPAVDPIRLSFLQFLIAGTLALGGWLLTGTYVSWENIRQAAVPLLYTGVFSSGVAYTLQIVAQRHARPSHAAIIMSMESVFAAVGGVIILHEQMSGRAIFGASLMLGGGILSQLASLGRQGILRKPAED